MRGKAETVRKDLRLAVPAPKVEARRPKPARSSERVQVRRALESEW